MGCDAAYVELGTGVYYISTHTSRVGCDIAFNLVDEHTVISTHTSRVGCDNLWDTLERRGLISTHTSRVGCDAVED